MVAEKEEKVVDRAEDSLTTDKKAAVVEEEADSGDKVYIQYLNINSDAITVKVDNTPYWLKARACVAFVCVCLRRVRPFHLLCSVLLSRPKSLARAPTIIDPFYSGARETSVFL